MPQYFAPLLTENDDRWTGHELDFEGLDDLDSVVEAMRETGGRGRSLLFVEEEDEYLAVVRVDGEREVRTFISDARAVDTFPLAAMIMEDVVAAAHADDEEEGIRPEPVPTGDTDIVADFGVSGESLLDLCSEEGLLPADVVTAICEKAGCVDVLDDIRERSIV